MPESAEPQNDFLLEASMPEGSAPLESIVCTEELHRRPWRPPDFEKENRALVALVTALSDSASTIFQTLAERILEVTECDSSGLSLLTPDGGKGFYWPAIAGMWAPHVGGGTPRNFGPCGDVLDRNCTILFRHFERRAAVSAAQRVDGTVPRDRREPRQKWPRGIVGMADAVQSEQHVLHDLFDKIRRTLSRADDVADKWQDLAQQPVIGNAIASLCCCHQRRPAGLALSGDQ